MFYRRKCTRLQLYSTPIHRHIDALRCLSYRFIAYGPLLLNGRSRHGINDNFPNSVGERRTHHGEVICKKCQLAIDLPRSGNG